MAFLSKFFSSTLVGLFILFECALAVSADTAAVACLAGSNSVMQIHDHIVGNGRGLDITGDDRILQLWRESEAGKASIQKICREPQRPGVSVPQNVYDTIQSQFAALENRTELFTSPVPMRTCIEASMKFSSNKSAPAYYCANATTARSELKDTPCISEQVVDYTTWVMQKAFDCMSPIDHPIDPKMFFKKINNESKFSFFLASTSGIGVMQLVTESAVGMGNKAGKKFIADLMLDNPRCEVFRQAQILDHKIKTVKVAGKDVASHCQLLSPGSGFARNALLGMGVYLYYRDSDDRNSSVNLFEGWEGNPEYKKIIDYFTLVSYNGGAAGGATFRKIKSQLSAKMSFNDFKKIVDRNSLYLRQINIQNNELLEAVSQKHSGGKEALLECMQ